MQIDNLSKEMQEALKYLEECDNIGGDINKRVPLTISIPLKLKKKLEKLDNVSRFVEEKIYSSL